ncbi:sensor histidine kinase [Cellulosilyticum sp. I15G10I2]|uniref:sensor histidine kinase n=1 Tax=Cellulosilyticum sp. I15G10I2 TaxID=1892843 RepID=UPI00085C255A|nr:sensor histidine kinase [Cellulosilyticum sp. I15G10I2]
MTKLTLDISTISKINKKIIGEISTSREQILDIIDNIRSEQESLKIQLDQIKNEVIQTICEADELEKKDKAMRKRLAEVSENFHKYTEEDVKEAYEKAADTRVKFYTKQNQEKMLREKRTQLEIALKKSMQNIDSAEKIVGQISVALSYLEGDMLSALGGTDKNSEMYLGIKILEAQEDERRRIVRDIHDGPAQHMANAIMKVDICDMVIQKDLTEGLKELASLKESVKIALKEVRNIIFDLRPMSLDDLGLNQTIREMIKSITKESKMDVKLLLKPIQEEIEPIIQVAVYRIIQEVFNNIKKHARAKNVAVKLDFGTKYLMLILSDDGVGFNVEETLKHVKNRASSYGLIGIIDRVNQLQGKIEIKSSQGAGTTYTVKLPINREVISDEKRGH